MRYLLALETSGKSGSVAILAENGDPGSLLSRSLPVDIGSAQSLVPNIATMLNDAKIGMADIGCIALLTGPGSFTGLRVGVATAKAIAYARKIPVVELDTLDVISHQCRSDVLKDRTWMHCILDAYRGQLFAKTFRIQSDVIAPRLEEATPTRVVDIDSFFEECKSMAVAQEHVFAGPGCQRIERFLKKEDSTGQWGQWASPICFWSEPDSDPQASTVAVLALEKWRNRDWIDPFALIPHYYRGSAAEEKIANPPR